jgi:hypothetical protein
VCLYLFTFKFPPIFFCIRISEHDVDREDLQGNLVPGTWRAADNDMSTWQAFHPLCSNNHSNEARLIREEYKEYFNMEGAVPWQWRQCGI